MSNSTQKSMGIFARYLTLWIFLSMVVGIIFGNIAPAFIRALAHFEVVHINLTVAILIWIMILPMLLKIDYSTLHKVWQHRNGIIVTIGINWLVKPFSMALLGWFFIYHVFSDYLDPMQWDGYYAGLVILAAAPCTAMVFVWSKLSGGDAQFTLSQVALNDIIMVVLFAPIVGLLLGMASIQIPWNTLLLSVLLYIIVPVVIALFWRKYLLKQQCLESMSLLSDEK